MNRPSAISALNIFLIVLWLTCPSRSCHTWRDACFATRALSSWVSPGAIDSMSIRYSVWLTRDAVAIILLFLMRVTCESSKIALIPRSVAADKEKRLPPRFGANRASWIIPSCQTPSTLVLTRMSPMPRAKIGRLSFPMPLIERVPGEIEIEWDWVRFEQNFKLV